MAGRFPLFTDACVNGHLVDALVQHGWNLVRAVDLYPQRTPDPVVFARAAQEGRVFVSNDGPIERLARSWLAEGRFFRMVFWPQEDTDAGRSGSCGKPSKTLPQRMILSRIPSAG